MKQNNTLRKKILKEAYLNGLYKNNKTLDETIKIKKITIDYVIDRLEEKKLFSRIRYIIDLNALNLGKFAWFFISINWEHFDYDEFIKKMTKIPQVHTTANVTGYYDLAIKIIGSSIQDVNQKILTIENIFPEIVDSQVHFMNREYKAHFELVKQPTKYKLKKIDFLILNEKEQNPNITIGEIAKKHKLHRNTVSNKWNKFWDENILIKKTLKLNHPGFEYIDMGLKTFIIIKSTPGKQEIIIKKLINYEQIQDIFTTIENEIIIIARLKNTYDLSNFHRLLAKACPNIKTTNTILFLTKKTKAGLSGEEIKFILNKNHL